MYYAHLRHMDRNPDIRLLCAGDSRPTFCFQGPSERETVVSVELSTPQPVHSEIFKRKRKKCVPLVFDFARQWPAHQPLICVRLLSWPSR